MLKNTIDITVGRRKSAVARVKVKNGNGKILVNNRKPDEYFKRESLVMMMNQPFTLVDLDSKYNFHINVYGGGLSGQAGAVRLGISRSLEKINPDFRSALKRAGMLVRDSRVVERKKYGQPGARKKFQFSKR
ncbi:MAG: 30S ribosomal protein S9 [Candidatus Marinimicrobia bacterium]|jgi:small subunit ribosomal protein S9|nr:30S ribosomal protein S9 [Candidatus Neomarinimicrobiota bacterium]|tara:strand:+ start:2384 stop:2779 length:396 start_codon:yes stop_codon:yes gene_type:complete